MILTIAFGIILAAIIISLLPAIIYLLIVGVAMILSGMYHGIPYLLWLITFGKYGRRL